MSEPPESQESARSCGGGRVESKDRVRSHEDRLQAVVNTAVDGIITIDSDGVVETFNPAAERIFGYGAAEVIGQNVRILMPPPYREEHQGYIDRYRRTGEAKIIGVGRQVTGRRKDGRTFPMDLAVSEIDHLGLFVGIVRDLTEQKRSEEQLRQADRLASIGSLAAGLGHDMNNVLLPMRGHLDALESLDLEQSPRQHIRAIRDSVSYLQQLTDGLHLLALDPLDGGASDQHTDIEEWWHQVGPLLQRSLPRHVRLASSMSSDLPLVAVAPHRLTQIALNLLVNAGDAVGEDGRVRVRAIQVADANQVRLEVSDNGCGMTPEVRARALEPFFSTKNRGRGTGLGLALVRGIVSAVGGTIQVESEVGKGTTVALHLPVARGSRASLPVGEDTGPLRAVISLEDDRIASLMETILKSDGITVSHASNADPNWGTLWITSPTDSDVDLVQRFAKTAGHVVIACGSGAGAWSRIGALVIEDVMDFDSIRETIHHAVSRLETTNNPRH